MMKEVAHILKRVPDVGERVLYSNRKACDYDEEAVVEKVTTNYIEISILFGDDKVQLDTKFDIRNGYSIEEGEFVYIYTK